MSAVIIKNCDSYQLELLKNQLSEGISLLGGWDKFIKPGMTVLLKVNLIGPKKSSTGAVTHSEFVRAVTQILIDYGCTVWIGDSSGGAIAGIAPTAQGFIVSGNKKVAEEEGAIIKNFDKEGAVVRFPINGHVDRIYLAKPLFEADFIINLPKLKTHSAGIYTGAFKNLFGCIPGLKKAEYHRMAQKVEELGLIIADIHQQVKVGLHIMDAVLAMQGEGPTAGEVYHAGKILISTDPLALDVVAADMIGMDIDDIPILTSARDKNIGEADLHKISIKGDFTTPPRLPGFKYPKKYRSNQVGKHAVLVKLIDFLKARPVVNSKECKDCNVCVVSCPVGAINPDTKKIDYETCIECMCCHELCMHEAVKLKRDNMLADLFIRMYHGKYG